MSEQEKINQSIARGLAFLSKRQLPWGEFRTYSSYSPIFSGECLYSSSPFHTTFLVYAMQFVKSADAKKISEKAVDFLADEMQPLGLWKYYGKRSKLYRWLPPDADDTCCAALVISKHRPDLFIDPSDHLIKDSKGLYHTFIQDRRIGFFDCVVNANVVAFLGENAKTKDSIRTLVKMIEHNQTEKYLVYYPSLEPLYYCLSRAYFNGVKGFGDAASKIMKTMEMEILQKIASPLKAALMLCTMLNFSEWKTKHSTVEILVDFLLKSQDHKSGGWKREPFFLMGSSRLGFPEVYFGSEDLTTAFALEGLARCLD